MDFDYILLDNSLIKTMATFFLEIRDVLLTNSIKSVGNCPKSPPKKIRKHQIYGFRGYQLWSGGYHSLQIIIRASVCNCGHYLSMAL